MSLDFLNIGDTPEPLRRYHEIVVPRLEPFAELDQHGIREGTTLHDHILGGAYFIGTVLDAPAIGYSDKEIELLLAAFTIHDANKMLPEHSSLARALRSEDFPSLCHGLDLHLFLDDFDAHLDDLRQLAVNTAQKWGRPMGALLRPQAEADQLLGRLRPAMSAADIHDLSRTFDESEQKEKLRALLAQGTHRPLYLLHHRLAEHLGPFTALLHSAAADCATKRGAVPVWVYPEGTWYLGPASELDITPDEVCAAYARLRDEAMGAGIEALLDKNVKDGFKLSPRALERWTDEDLTDRLADFIRSKGAEPIWKNLSERLLAIPADDPRRPERLPSGTHWPRKLDDVTPGRLWLAAENLLKHKDAGFTGAPAERLVEEVARAGIDAGPLRALLAVPGLAPVYERPYLLTASIPDPWATACAAFRAAAAIVRQQTGAQVGQSTTLPEVHRYVETTLSWGGRTGEARFATYLQQYLKGQRSSIGAALGPVDDLMSSEMLGDTRVTQFSNTIPGGTGDPKRQRDALQGEAMAVQARTSLYGKAAPPLYLHLFPAAGSTRYGWDARAGSLDRLRKQNAAEAPSYKAISLRVVDGMTHEWRSLFFGQVPPSHRALHGNGMAVPIAPPPDASDTLAYLEAAHSAAHFIQDTRLRGVVSPFLCVLAPAENDRLRLEGPPFLLRGPLAEADFGRLLARMDALAILNLKLQPRLDRDVRMDLVRAAGRPLIAVLYTIDRLIEKRDASDWGAIRLAALALPHAKQLAETTMTDTFQTSEALRKMAQLAVEKHLYGYGPNRYNRNNLLRSLNETFKSLRRARAHDDAELALANAEDRIFTALETQAARSDIKLGREKRLAIRSFVDHIRQILKHGYNDNLARMRADERLLRSAYITFVRAALDARFTGADTATEDDTEERAA